MLAIFGPKVVANCKVQKKKVSYSDPAVSRIFFKIHETLKKTVKNYNEYLGVYQNK
jgi:ribosomal protein L14E/L6E/L27E